MKTNFVRAVFQMNVPSAVSAHQENPCEGEALITAQLQKMFLRAGILLGTPNPILKQVTIMFVQIFVL